jgi:hypothetical protein
MFSVKTCRHHRRTFRQQVLAIPCGVCCALAVGYRRLATGSILPRRLHPIPFPAPRRIRPHVCCGPSCAASTQPMADGPLGSTVTMWGGAGVCVSVGRVGHFAKAERTGRYDRYIVRTHQPSLHTIGHGAGGELSRDIATGLRAFPPGLLGVAHHMSHEAAQMCLVGLHSPRLRGGVPQRVGVVTRDVGRGARVVCDLPRTDVPSNTRPERRCTVTSRTTAAC